ncbi:MAG: PIN domain-containing protein [Euryarchaeota archaeon]|nr:PIN domain-containing protein [Euryarchaeota archaeon]
MRLIAWDTWAFLESYFEWPRHEAVRALLADASMVFTVRDVVAESFNHIVHKTGRTEEAWTWLESLSASRVKVYEPSFRDVYAFMGQQSRTGSLSFTDHALAYAAVRDDVVEIATEDAEFRRLDLVPIFARS